MPRVSEFIGIVIYMYCSDHAPPHFYAEHEAVYTIDTLETLRGKLPRRANGMVIEWAQKYRNELRDNWDRARGGVQLHQIDPLD